MSGAGVTSAAVHSVDRIAAARRSARVQQDGDYMAAQLAIAEESMRTVAAGFAGGLRRWHVLGVMYAVVGVVAGGVVWGLSIVMPAILALVVAVPLAVAGAHFAARWLVAWRHAAGRRDLDSVVCRLNGPVLNYARELHYANLSAGLVKTLISKRGGWRKLPMPGGACWSMGRAEDTIHSAWRAAARAIHAAADIEVPPTYRRPIETPEPAATRSAVEDLAEAYARLDSVLDAVTSRAGGTTMSTAVSSIDAARDVLWGGMLGLTNTAAANAALRYARYAQPRLFASSGIVIATSTAGVWGLWSVLPSAVAVGLGLAMGLAISDFVSPWVCRDRTAWAKARRAAEKTAPATMDSIQVMFEVWRAELDRQRDHLTVLADKFTSGDQPWQTATLANLRIADDWLHHADTALADTAEGLR